jgi:hypothetical protein
MYFHLYYKESMQKMPTRCNFYNMQYAKPQQILLYYSILYYILLYYIILYYRPIMNFQHALMTFR